MKTTFIGIDVSSATLDILVDYNSKHKSFVLKNQVADVKRFFNQYDDENVVIAMENTGRYNWILYAVLANLKCQVYVINPLHLKRSLGLIRGKSDKIDAARICKFIQKHHTELKQWQPCSKAIQKLKILLSERDGCIRQKRLLLQQKHEYRFMEGLDVTDVKLRNAANTKFLDEQIAQIEKAIRELIKQDPELSSQSQLMQTVPGVGKVLSWYIIAKTEGFKLVNEARKLACYAGVVPFEHQSGTSIRGRTRVSVYADKSLKSLLHLGAMSAIRLNNDLRAFYLRKVAEGKNKMSTLNAVRNKIIHRVFAVIRSQKEYTPNLLMS